jgi:hypothetical protein
MPLSDDIRGLADQVLDRVDEAREFYVHSRQAWRLVQQLARKGRPGLMPVRNRRIIVPPVEHRPQLEARAESQGPSQGNREEDFSATDETRMEHG